MWRKWLRYLREIDWNWRNFNGAELVIAGTCMLFVVLAPILAYFRWWFAVAIVLGEIPGLFLQFVGANVGRQGLIQPWEPHSGRPISIGALQLILGGGFLATAALLGLLIWISR